MMVGRLHHRTPNLIGQTFGFLTVVSAAHVSEGETPMGVSLRVRGAKECGGYGIEKRDNQKLRVPDQGHAVKARTTHGMSKHSAFAVWRSMLDRCKLPTHHRLEELRRAQDYCLQTMATVRGLLGGYGGSYQPGLTLDRADNNSGYYKQNCRWVPARAQAMNRRNAVRAVDIPELSEKTGISRSTLYCRIAHG